MTAELRHAGALEVSGSVRHGDFRLDTDLRFAPGEVCAVVGANGAGKSTLLRLVAGLDSLDEGRIRLGDTAFDAPADDVFVPVQRRRVGLVFQSYRLFPHLSVLDNVAFAARADGCARRTARGEAVIWLKQFGLTALADRRPHQLSGGQAQRVALTRALAARPATLLLDEPLAALDPDGRATVRDTLAEHLRAFAGPVLLVSHEPDDARALADRVVRLEHGRVADDSACPADSVG